MKNNVSKIVFGLTAILLGALLLLSAFDIIDFRDVLPFWTLFIIIPTVVSMITSGITLWKTALLALGVNALICQQNWGQWGWKQFLIVNLAVCFILLGIYLLFGDKKKNKIQPQQPYTGAQGQQQYSAGYQQGNGTPYSTSAPHSNIKSDLNPKPVYNAILSKGEFSNSCQNLLGATINAVLGGASVDLTYAQINSDTVINISSILGGVDLFVPTNVRIEVSGTPILGGCDNFVTTAYGDDVPCLIIKYTAILGGVNIRIR